MRYPHTDHRQGKDLSPPLARKDRTRKFLIERLFTMASVIKKTSMREIEMGRLLTLKTYGKFMRGASEADLPHEARSLRPLRWFILSWAGVVFLWGCAQFFLGDMIRLPLGDLTVIIQFTRNIPSAHLSQLPPPRDQFFSHIQIAPLFKLVCVALLMVQWGLHWLCLSGKVRRSWCWGYFLLQGGCVLAMSLIWTDPIIVLGLYLALAIEALSLLKQVRQFVTVSGIALAFFLVMLAWRILQMALWMSFESLLLLLIFLIGWIILSAQQIHARSQLEAAHLQLAAYAMRVEELTLLNERQRLARELHDILAQDLVGLTLQLERIDLHLEKQRVERARELVQQAMSRARVTLAEARGAIDDLRAQTFGPGDLLLIVQRDIARFSEMTSIPCTTDVAALAEVPGDLCEHVLRAITEGLTNVARHAQASQVWICAHLHKARLMIEIRDDGIGFASAEILLKTGHYGLLGMRERARLCGGQLDIESAVGKGTLLRLGLPLAQRGDTL